jgi:hypothetical protein
VRRCERSYIPWKTVAIAPQAASEEMSLPESRADSRAAMSY